jgi:peptidoglycan lytic transglycosylase G
MKRGYRIALFFGFVLVTLFAYEIFLSPHYFNGDRFIIVSKGESFENVTDSLLNAGIITNRFYFSAAGRILAWTTKMQVGKFRFKSGVSNFEILDILRGGKTIETIAVTIPEGMRTTTVARICAVKLGIDSARFMRLVNDSVFAHRLGVDEGNLNGYLMPKTYAFYWQTDEEVIIKTLASEFWQDVDSNMLAQAKRRGKKLHEIITLASIIELETAIDSERAIIAGVYYNRLQRRMRLQADPTVQYALGGERRRLHFSDLKVQSPYNTYVNYGLPPGPINNPGLASITAALYPVRHRYLYFVATGEGGHRFSLTFDQHEKAKMKYIRTREEHKEERQTP